MRTLGFKCPDDSPIWQWLEGQANASAALRYAVEQYITNGGNPPPPPPEPVAPAPIGGAAIDYKKLGRVMYRSTLLALKKAQVAIPTSAPQNQVASNGQKQPKRAKGRTTLIDGERVAVIEHPSQSIDDILGGVDDWSNTR